MNKTYFVEGMNVGLRRRLTHQRVRPALVTTAANAAADVIVVLVSLDSWILKTFRVGMLHSRVY